VHKVFLNALRLDLRLEARGPLLVKSGLESPDPSLPDMQFVRTWQGEGATVYIPGSSLKGVFRSFAERALRTAGVEVCEPLGGGGCGAKLKKEEEDTARIYRQSCMACKLFGHTRLRGRLSFTDFLPADGLRTEVRYGVAISRLSNAVAQGPFEMETVVAGSFRGTLFLENFEAWQVGLVALCLRALEEGLLRVGFGKNRGFGRMGVIVEGVELEAVGGVAQDSLPGVGYLAGEEMRRAYGLRADDSLAGLPPPDAEEGQAFFVRRRYPSQWWERVEEAALEALVQAVEA